jgi:hypothetical protein
VENHTNRVPEQRKEKQRELKGRFEGKIDEAFP